MADSENSPQRLRKPLKVEIVEEGFWAIAKPYAEAIIVITAVVGLWLTFREYRLAAEKEDEAETALHQATNALSLARQTETNALATLEIVKRLRDIKSEAFYFPDTNRVLTVRMTNGNYILYFLLKQKPMEGTLRTEISLVVQTPGKFGNFERNTFALGLSEYDFGMFRKLVAVVYYSADVDQSNLVTNMVPHEGSVYLFGPDGALKMPVNYDSLVSP